MVLSYGYWRTHFQDDRGVVGRVLQVNRHPFTIIGVAPQGFHGTMLFFNPDVFLPIVNAGQTGGNDLNKRGSRWVFMTLGHLKDGVTPAQAAADLNSITADLAKTYPKDDGKVILSLAKPGLYGDYLGRPVKAFMTALMLLAGLILLAACANLGSLFAARRRSARAKWRCGWRWDRRARASRRKCSSKRCCSRSPGALWDCTAACSCCAR